MWTGNNSRGKLNLTLCARPPMDLPVNLDWDRLLPAEGAAPAQPPWVTPKDIQLLRHSCVKAHKTQRECAETIWAGLRAAHAAGDLDRYSFTDPKTGEVFRVGDALTSGLIFQVAWLKHYALHVGGGFVVEIKRYGSAPCGKGDNPPCSHTGPGFLRGEVCLTRIGSDKRRFTHLPFYDKPRPGKPWAPPLERVYRGLSSIGPVDYNIVHGNCQHFVTMCFRGSPAHGPIHSDGAVKTIVIIVIGCIIAWTLSSILLESVLASRRRRRAHGTRLTASIGPTPTNTVAPRKKRNKRTREK